MKTVAVSGGFDPVHVGHLNLFRSASKLGDELVVVVNNDNWLRAKKGYCFMPQNYRRELLEEFEVVDRTVLTTHEPEPDSVDCLSGLKQIDGLDVFANGGDRKSDNIPEYDYCENNGIEMEFQVGGFKLQSSSELVERAARKIHYER